MNELIGYNSEEDNIVKSVSRSFDTPETDTFFFRTDIEWDDEVEFARKLERKLTMAIQSLKFIAEEGGKTLESEYGDIHCNGIWCSDQAQHALYALEDMK